jgi:hypothetical protein
LQEKFIDWQKEMWVLLKKHNLEREIAKRPNYFKMWDTAEKLHLD